MVGGKKKLLIIMILMARESFTTGVVVSLHRLIMLLQNISSTNDLIVLPIVLKDIGKHKHWTTLLLMKKNHGEHFWFCRCALYHCILNPEIGFFFMLLHFYTVWKIVTDL